MKSFAKVVIIFDSAILKIIIIIVNLFIIEIIEFILWIRFITVPLQSKEY